MQETFISLLTAEVGPARLDVLVADITTLDVDAIVNAANRTLLGGGGVDGVWSGGKKNEEELLASCYRTALDLAASHGLTSIAFPAISTGVYAFPADRAARIAVGTVVSELSADPRGLRRAVFCCFSEESARHHMNAFAELGLA